MKKHILLAILILLALPAVALAGQEPCKGISIQKLRKQVPIPPAKILSKRAVGGMCEVILDIRGQYVPVYAGPDYVIAGEMFRNRKQVTQRAINHLRAEKFTSLKAEVEKCVAMTLKPKTRPITTTVYMVTDPVCPYCHRAESKLQEYAEKYGAEFKLILYSVHPPVGRQKAIEAVCRKLSAQEYLAGSWKNDKQGYGSECQAGKDLVRRSEQLVRNLGIRGVPMFYLDDGRLVAGANMPALARALSLGTRSKMSSVK